MANAAKTREKRNARSYIGGIFGKITEKFCFWHPNLGKLGLTDRRIHAIQKVNNASRAGFGWSCSHALRRLPKAGRERQETIKNTI